MAEKHLEYLDDIRESGVTNMYGSPAYLERDFGLSEKEAGDIFIEWKDTFAARHNLDAG